MNDQFEYLEETFLIEDLAAIELGLSKTASLFDDLHLNSVADAVKSFVSEHMKDSSQEPGGYFTSILNLLAPAMIMRVHPILGILYLIADHYGYGLSDMVKKIVTELKPKIDSGESIQPGDITTIGKNVLGISAESSFIDSLYLIKKEARYLQLKKIAGPSTLDDLKNALLGSQKNRSSIPTDIPFLFGDGNASIIQKVFGSLFSNPVGGRTVKWLLGGFAIWLVKTVLAGAGVLALSEGVASLIGHPKKDLSVTPNSTINNSNSVQTQVSNSPQNINPTEFPTHLNPSSIISDKPKTYWVVPLVGDGTIQDTLRIWTLDLYPELNQYPNINDVILNNSHFKGMVSILSSDPANIGQNSLVMPSQFSTRKEVIDSFISSIKGSL